jgi:hypothetical protein
MLYAPAPNLILRSVVNFPESILDPGIACADLISERRSSRLRFVWIFWSSEAQVCVQAMGKSLIFMADDFKKLSKCRKARQILVRWTFVCENSREVMVRVFILRLKGPEDVRLLMSGGAAPQLCAPPLSGAHLHFDKRLAPGSRQIPQPHAA